ncbi:GNAT family N-acetyltransferase [Bacillus sp. V59.32b]|uniref:GNAT family N-acetyltransferase n=1 Tax=Bacillus sp. V59.32b TaxID=1758642 RepID=UPI000E3EE49C|nr:GNAT family N-acetyltransferase [Bacillus sp. V59.32b]RFU60030.1 N-acetyltransferase [Bacillus sp. V59.32b]
MEIVYETKRLQLKVFTKNDVEIAKTFWGDPEVMEHCTGATPHHLLPKVLAFYQKCHYEKGLSVYSVVEKNSGQVMGAAGFNVIDTLNKIELIYHFSKINWGKGYASEAVNACIAMAKQHGDVNIIHASVDPGNINSTKILQKVGFRFIEMKWFSDTGQEELYFEYKIK